MLGGKKELMDYFVHPDARKRVLLAGTYNAHPVPTLAAIATIERLLQNNGEIYNYVERLGSIMENGIQEIARQTGLALTIARQGSALCIYFMDHAPLDWHDLASHHAFAADQKMREDMIRRGIYFFPIPAKQCSISAAHTEEDIANTLAALDHSCRLTLQMA